MTDTKKDESWYTIWQNWMSPEAGNQNDKERKKDNVDDWYELWSKWMAPDDALVNDKDKVND